MNDNISSQAYIEKLRDPRWQKVRLKIFERDDWKCVFCGRSHRPLHIHHISYTASEPWNESAENLKTLCDDCHAAEHGIEDSDLRATTLEMPPQSARQAKDCVMEGVETIQKLYETRGAISGIPTGIADFDAMTDGLHPGEMVVIAARPSMGKTALALNIADYVAVEQRLPVVIFSLEMTGGQIAQRMICSRARVNLARVRDGYLNERDFSAITSAATRLAESQLWLDDAGDITLVELSQRLRYFVAKHGTRLAIVDYLQLLRSRSRRARDNRQAEIAEISAGIKALAKELRIPIIALSQLNRNPEARGESRGRPRLSDLRESGAIEQDADLVALLVREEYYADTDEDRQALQGRATFIIAKQRNGPVGDIDLTFLKEITRFETTTPSEEY